VTLPPPNPADLVNLFLENACADPILTRGPARNARRQQTALRMLRHHPEIAHASLHTAVVCGDLETVERTLADRPEAASQPGGPLRKRDEGARESLWPPLLHLCYGRLPLPAAGDNAIAIGRLLLDHGADPNAYFEAGSHPCRYTALCGIAGEGEEGAPAHPQREELYRLLLDRGAESYDIQVFYNTHFSGNIIWLLKLVHEFSVKAGRQQDWKDPEWSMLSMGGYGCGARYFLEIAVGNNDLELAEWILAHGASPNAPPGHPKKLAKRIARVLRSARSYLRERQRFRTPTLHQVALDRGFTELAVLLTRYGAKPGVQDGRGAFAAAGLHLDRARAQALALAHPEYLRDPSPLTVAAEHDLPDVAALLLDLGMSPDIADPTEGGQRPLHVAAYRDSARVGALLIERGAEIDPVESNWSNTPLSAAGYTQSHRMIELLGRVSRDVWGLVLSGSVERLREVFRIEPEKAKLTADGHTLLMWLPDIEDRALAVAELLLAHGADPSLQSPEGLTAADLADRRFMPEVAALLRGRGG
jgi:ankyrin repeat protein